MTTRREYFMQNPDRFRDFVEHNSGEKPCPLDKERARRSRYYIVKYMCDNTDCELCQGAPYDGDGDECEERLARWLDAPFGGDLMDLDPEDREAVQKILDRAVGAKKKDLPRADGAVTAKKASEMVEPAHYVLFPDINVLDVIKVILNRAELNPIESFYLGNAIKYVLRADQKGRDEDYKKAITYLTWLVESLK